MTMLIVRLRRGGERRLSAGHDVGDDGDDSEGQRAVDLRHIHQLLHFGHHFRHLQTDGEGRGGGGLVYFLLTGSQYSLDAHLFIGQLIVGDDGELHRHLRCILCTKTHITHKTQHKDRTHSSFLTQSCF